MTAWLPVLLVVALAAGALDGDAGLRRWLHLRSELAQAGERMEALRSELDALRAEAAALEADDFAIERAIREELGLVRAGERVLRLSPHGISSARNP